MINLIALLFVVIGFILTFTKFKIINNIVGFIFQAIGLGIFAVLNLINSNIIFGVFFIILFIGNLIFVIKCLKEYKKFSTK